MQATVTVCLASSLVIIACLAVKKCNNLLGQTVELTSNARKQKRCG